jgi:hypothetical protein
MWPPFNQFSSVFKGIISPLFYQSGKYIFFGKPGTMKEKGGKL